MYSYVSKKVVRKQKKTCRKALIAANAILREKYNLQPHLVTVGSGSKYLVTKWDDEPFDLDFNLVFYTLPHEYIVQPMLLKNTLRVVLDQVLIKRGFTHGKDSTSVLTYSHKKSLNQPQGYSLDIGILFGVGGTLNRLIHQKDNPDRFIWNETKINKSSLEQAKQLRKMGRWLQVRKIYLNLKNKYGKDTDLPSFIVFAEALNLTWQSIPKDQRPLTEKRHVSGKTHTQSQMNHHANQGNPNNVAHKATKDNRANQMNPNNPAYRGVSKM